MDKYFFVITVTHRRSAYTSLGFTTASTPKARYFEALEQLYAEYNLKRLARASTTMYYIEKTP